MSSLKPNAGRRTELNRTRPRNGNLFIYVYYFLVIYVYCCLRLFHGILHILRLHCIRCFLLRRINKITAAIAIALRRDKGIIIIYFLHRQLNKTYCIGSSIGLCDAIDLFLVDWSDISLTGTQLELVLNMFRTANCRELELTELTASSNINACRRTELN